jgi:hypothetical protein
LLISSPLQNRLLTVCRRVFGLAGTWRTGKFDDLAGKFADSGTIRASRQMAILNAQGAPVVAGMQTIAVCG